jgi:phage protein U
MLGGHAFTAGGGFSFTELSRETDAEWSKIEVTGREAALHWTGPKSQDITIKGVLFPVALGGLGELDGLRADCSAGKVMTLVTGAGDNLGRYVLEKVSEEMSQHSADASPGKVSYTLKLRRASGAGGGFGGGIGGLLGSLAGAALSGAVQNVLSASLAGLPAIGTAAAQALTSGAAPGPISAVAAGVAEAKSIAGAWQP